MSYNYTDYIEDACAHLASLGPKCSMLKQMWENLDITEEGKKMFFVSLKEYFDSFEHIKHVLKTEASHFKDPHAKIQALENNEMYKWSKEMLQTEEAKRYHN